MRNFVRGTFVLFLSVLSISTFATDYPLTVTDGLGNQVTLNRAPTSIASLTLFTDELFVDILDTNKLSHMTNLATDPTYSNIVDKVPSSVKLTEFNVEVLVSDYPDIIFAANWSEAPKVKQLKDAGLTVYLIDTPVDMESIAAEILKIGTIVNARNEAQIIVDTMNNKLDKAKEAINYGSLNALDYSTWGTSSGKHSTYNAIVTAAGLVNSVAEYETGPYGQVPMSKELIIEIDPDVLFLPGYVYGDTEGATNFKSQMTTDTALVGVNALKNGRIIMIPEALRGTFSHYIADAVVYVVEQLNAQQ